MVYLYVRTRSRPNGCPYIIQAARAIVNTSKDDLGSVTGRTEHLGSEISAHNRDSGIHDMPTSQLHIDRKSTNVPSYKQNDKSVQSAVHVYLGYLPASYTDTISQLYKLENQESMSFGVHVSSLLPLHLACTLSSILHEKTLTAANIIFPVLLADHLTSQTKASILFTASRSSLVFLS